MTVLCTRWQTINMRGVSFMFLRIIESNYHGDNWKFWRGGNRVGTSSLPTFYQVISNLEHYQ